MTKYLITYAWRAGKKSHWNFAYALVNDPMEFFKEVKYDDEECVLINSLPIENLVRSVQEADLQWIRDNLL